MSFLFVIADLYSHAHSINQSLLNFALTCGKE